MPLRALTSIYRRKVLGNPWLYHAKWWIQDVAMSATVRTKVEGARLKDTVVASTKVIPATARAIVDQARNKF
jgi:hypothetical protein